MILGMSVGAFTILHVIITLVAIGSGLIVVGGMFASNKLPVTTALFLFTTALTSLTGFLFPIHGFTGPSAECPHGSSAQSVQFPTGFHWAQASIPFRISVSTSCLYAPRGHSQTAFRFWCSLGHVPINLTG